MKENLDFLVTLWPSFPHYRRFAADYRLAGIRLNSAMIHAYELDDELAEAAAVEDSLPLFFDIKGRQLRVTDVIPTKDHLELELNHPIKLETPVMVLFKGGEDYALLEKVIDQKHLIFRGGPHFNVYPGESLQIRHPSLQVGGPVFCEYEIEKIRKARARGFAGWFLSYVEQQRDLDEFRDYIGTEPVIAKIENKKGLAYAAGEFRKKENLTLMAACGDLYVEIDKPHHIMDALKLIIRQDPQAYAGSRMLLSLVGKPIPSCADLLQLAWLYDTGYRRMMLCDELCLKEELLATAINVLESFRNKYAGSITK